MNPAVETKMSTRQVQALEHVAFVVARGENLEIIKSWWEKFITDVVTSGVPIDVNDLVQDVLRQSYLESSRDLQIYADKVNLYNRTQKEIRDMISRLEEEQNSLGDDAQLANIDLQNALQKQQQLIQMISNISKTLSETALAVIQKIGG